MQPRNHGYMQPATYRGHPGPTTRTYIIQPRDDPLRSEPAGLSSMNSATMNRGLPNLQSSVIQGIASYTNADITKPRLWKTCHVLSCWRTRCPTANRRCGSEPCFALFKN